MGRSPEPAGAKEVPNTEGGFLEEVMPPVSAQGACSGTGPEKAGWGSCEELTLACHGVCLCPEVEGWVGGFWAAGNMGLHFGETKLEGKRKWEKGKKGGDDRLPARGGRGGRRAAGAVPSPGLGD